MIDSHAHLTSRQFASDRDDVIRRAREAGLSHILCIGSWEGAGSVERTLEVAAQHDFIYASVGIHPHEAKDATDADYAHLEQLARTPKVLAWGEIGLDYWYDHSPREVQRDAFLRQLEIARGLKLSVIIHCRSSQNSTNAWDDTLALLRQHWGPTGLGGILHCFSGELHHAHSAIDLGFLISFAGNVTFPKAQDLRDAARDLPLDRILIETDSPYLAPVPHRGRRNEPAFVAETARCIAGVRGLQPDEVAAQASQNFLSLFHAKIAHP